MQRTLELGPGDLLLGMTDGLVERRGGIWTSGSRGELRLVGQGGGSLDDLVAAVGSEPLTDTRGRDDATILAVRFAT